MGFSDFKMAELTSDAILDCLENRTKISEETFNNFQISIMMLIKDGMSFGPNVKDLYHYLETLYSCSDVHSLKGFDKGAVYGSFSFYEKFKILEGL